MYSGSGDLRFAQNRAADFVVLSPSALTTPLPLDLFAFTEPWDAGNSEAPEAHLDSTFFAYFTMFYCRMFSCLNFSLLSLSKCE